MLPLWLVEWVTMLGIANRCLVLDGKGVIETLFANWAIPKSRFKALSAEEAPHLQPGRAAQVLSGGTVLGWVGEIHPMAAEAFEAQAPIVAFELDLDALIKAARPARDYVDVPVFPAVTMDVALCGGRRGYA